MAIGKIIQLVGIGVATLAGLIAIPQAAVIIALLGLMGGWWVASDDRMMFLVATVALVTVAGALGGIPAVGMYMTSVLTNLGALFAAAAVTVILMMTFEKVTAD